MQERWEAEQRLWIKGAASGAVPRDCLTECYAHHTYFMFLISRKLQHMELGGSNSKQK